MKRTKFSEQQIITILKEAESGLTSNVVAEEGTEIYR